jgi:hypothetical protein
VLNLKPTNYIRYVVKLKSETRSLICTIQYVKLPILIVGVHERFKNLYFAYH